MQFGRPHLMAGKDTTTMRIRISLREKVRTNAQKLNINMMDYLEKSIIEKEKRDAGASHE